MSKSLWDLDQGEKCLVTGFDSELAEDYRVRLMELGFHPGEAVVCVQAPRWGAPKLFRVHNTTYSLDDLIATRVETSEIR